MNDHKGPEYSHIFQLGALYDRRHNTGYNEATHKEATLEEIRYYDEGVRLVNNPEKRPSRKLSRVEEEMSISKTYSGRGIMYAIVDDRGEMGPGRSTIDVIADAIEEALDQGYETSDEIARYLTTSAFQHIPDRRVRFNSVLKAGDACGAQILRKLYNAYNDICSMATDTEDPAESRAIHQEATGFAEALQIVLSPFSSEDPDDPRLVDWDEVDRMTETFEHDQRYVRQARKGTPQ